jgi:hypothetical protein
MYSREKFIAQTKKLMYAIFTTKFSKSAYHFQVYRQGIHEFFQRKILDSAIGVFFAI